ncbi:MAG: phage head-tail connector protein [Immundisolibacteraceae bacterium]|nr:phage head-tail connector protein [Immundisolibacteraceae bacterium]
MVARKVIIKAASEPVTIEEVKIHLRIDDVAEDAYLTRLIKSGTEHIEGYLQRSIITKTVEAYFSGFQHCMELPLPNLQVVNSVKYYDCDGNLQTLDPSDYIVNDLETPSYIYKDSSVCWPSTKQVHNAVIINYVCGYGDATDVPQRVKQAILLVIGYLFNNREDHAGKVPTQAENLIDRDRIFKL